MPLVTASSFADPKDVEAYKKAIAQGKSEAEALKVGDNGIGNGVTIPPPMQSPCARYHQKIGLLNGEAAQRRVGRKSPSLIKVRR